VGAQVGLKHAFNLTRSRSERRYPVPMKPLQRGAKYTEVGKVCDFQLKSPFISETIRGRPIVAMER